MLSVQWPMLQHTGRRLRMATMNRLLALAVSFALLGLAALCSATPLLLAAPQAIDADSGEQSGC